MDNGIFAIILVTDNYIDIKHAKLYFKKKKKKTETKIGKTKTHL